MNLRRQNKSQKNRAQNDFTACKEPALLLKTRNETALWPSRQRRSPKFTSLFERWSTPTYSQAGVFLLRLAGGLRGPIRCGFWVAKPQDTDFDKIKEKRRLENVA
jgi:hypothetical protein